MSDRFARNEWDDFDQYGQSRDGCALNEAGPLIERLRRVAKAAQDVYPHCPDSGKTLVDRATHCELCSAITDLQVGDLGDL